MLEKKVAESHGPTRRPLLLLHTLLRARQTGYLSLWYNGWFVVLEPKTEFVHHFYFWFLHWMLQQLGLREGVYYKPSDREHREARRIAQKLIRETYHSHRVARRLHYLLRQKELVWNHKKEEEVYAVKVYHYPDGDVGLQVLDETGRREVCSNGLRVETSLRIEVYTALPMRHVDPRREETYRHRPAGLF